MGIALATIFVFQPRTSAAFLIAAPIVEQTSTPQWTYVTVLPAGIGLLDGGSPTDVGSVAAWAAKDTPRLSLSQPGTRPRATESIQAVNGVAQAISPAEAAPLAAGLHAVYVVMLLVAIVGAYLASRLPARLIEPETGEIPIGDALDARPR